jgi:hypothetical protein
LYLRQRYPSTGAGHILSHLIDDRRGRCYNRRECPFYPDNAVSRATAVAHVAPRSPGKESRWQGIASRNIRSPNIWGEDCRETGAFLPMVARRMVDLMPRLANIRVGRTWRGLYPMTPDGSPLVGWSKEVEGYLLAAGMCGQGFMLGPGLGELLARMVQRRTTPNDAETLAILSPYRELKGMENLK